MALHRLTNQAESDLRDIWSYIARSSIRYADQFIDEITSRFINLAEYPRLGKVRTELGPGIRSFPVRNYLIIYRPATYGVEIVRVIHGNRRITSLFDN